MTYYSCLNIICLSYIDDFSFFIMEIINANRLRKRFKFLSWKIGRQQGFPGVPFERILNKLINILVKQYFEKLDCSFSISSCPVPVGNAYSKRRTKITKAIGR